jgi:protease-4
MNLSALLKNILYIILIFSFAQPLIKSIKSMYYKSLEPHTKVGYLEINGILVDSQHHLKHLKRFFKDHDIKAILLKIESMGGIAGTSQVLFHELSELKKEFPKQVIVVTENACLSGAYWLACAADYIVASPVAWVGSIGTSIPFRFKLKDFINEHKIRYESTQAGMYKAATDPFLDTTPEQEAMFQELCNQTYEEFTQSIMSRRSKLSLTTVENWANGKVFTGRQAAKLGLIDKIGSMIDAVAWIKEKALIEGTIEWVKPPKSSIVESLFVRNEHDEEPSSVMNRLANALCTCVEQHYCTPRTMLTL